MATEVMLLRSECAKNYFPSDDDIEIKRGCPGFGRIHSSRMYAVNCTGLDKKSGIYEFMYALDDIERSNLIKEHELIGKIEVVANRFMRQGVFTGGATGVMCAVPFLIASPPIAIAGTISVLCGTMAMGVYLGYSKGQTIAHEIELNRLKRVADKVSLINMQYRNFEKEGYVRGMRNLQILKHYFEKTLNEQRSITFFTLET